MEQPPVNKITTKASTSNITVISLTDPEAKHLIVKASKEFGFFKLIDHGVDLDFITKVESEAMGFFAMSQAEKEKSGPPNPLGYRSKNIGRHGDVGWIEYLLFPAKPNLDFGDNPRSFGLRCALGGYISSVKKISTEVLELMADGLGVEPRQVFSKLIMEEESESLLRINHYPPCPELQQHGSEGTNILGFGAHTDPQIISILRANESSGYEILLGDGTWVSVPPDPNSFFVNIGDSLQVMTNGRFRSVKHRVLANGEKSRLTMVYFSGPTKKEKIGPMASLMGDDEPTLYKEMTWLEYITKARSMPLDYDKIRFIEKNVST